MQDSKSQQRSAWKRESASKCTRLLLSQAEYFVPCPRGCDEPQCNLGFKENRQQRKWNRASAVAMERHRLASIGSTLVHPAAIPIRAEPWTVRCGEPIKQITYRIIRAMRSDEIVARTRGAPAAFAIFFCQPPYRPHSAMW
jgi:hypothetical protein